MKKIGMILSVIFLAVPIFVFGQNPTLLQTQLAGSAEWQIRSSEIVTAPAEQCRNAIEYNDGELIICLAEVLQQADLSNQVDVGVILSVMHAYVELAWDKYARLSNAEAEKVAIVENLILNPFSLADGSETTLLNFLRDAKASQLYSHCNLDYYLGINNLIFSNDPCRMARTDNSSAARLDRDVEFRLKGDIRLIEGMTLPYRGYRNIVGLD